MKYKKNPLKVVSDISVEALARLSGKRIFFGHQSVGSNIVKGLKELNGVPEGFRFNIVEGESIEGSDGPIFLHARVGQNTKPRSKVDDFARMMDQGLGEVVDIAFFKLCYADINGNTDIKAVFQYYERVMGELRERYPRVTFFHCTVPYYRRSGGLKGLIKWLSNRDHNVGRDCFNELMRARYGAGELFDLGLIEATYPDGRRERGDRSAWALAPVYTDDGGHLNPKGRETIAVQLLYFLSTLVSRR